MPDPVLVFNPAAEPGTAMDHETIVNDICAAAQEVFSTMLGVEVAPGPAFTQNAPGGAGDGVMSLIGLAGPWTGAGSIMCSAACACKMASFLLMTEYTAVNHEVLDAMAELTNMIVGSFKTLIEPRTGALGLSIPSVVYGHNFMFRNGSSEEWTVIPLRFGEHELELRLCLARSQER